MIKRGSYLPKDTLDLLEQMVLHRKHSGAKYLVQSTELRVTVKIHV